MLDVVKDYLAGAGVRDGEEGGEREIQGNMVGGGDGQSGDPTAAEGSDSLEDEVRGLLRAHVPLLHLLGLNLLIMNWRCVCEEDSNHRFKF